METHTHNWLERTELLLGSEKLELLRNAHVLVVGLGGVGAYAAEMIARAGVGRMTIADADTVSPSNINRQLVALHSTVGRPKAEVLAERLRDINPDIELTVVNRYIRDEETYTLLDAARYDYVVDAIDTISAKLTIAKYAQNHDIRLVSSMGGANKLHPECLRFADIFDTVRDPMSRIMRKECKKRGIKSLHVLFSCEESVKTQPRDPSNIHERTELGTASFMPPIMGQMIAGEVIRQISGRGTERVRSDGQRLD